LPDTLHWSYADSTRKIVPRCAVPIDTDRSTF
jgi:hypothetical protein